MLAPDLQSAVTASGAAPVHVVGCHASGFGLLPACDPGDNFPCVNHWVVGEPLVQRPPKPPLKEFPWSSSTAVSRPAASSGTLKAASLLAGFAIRETRMDGECGIHCMNIFQAGPGNGRLTTRLGGWGHDGTRRRGGGVDGERMGNTASH